MKTWQHTKGPRERRFEMWSNILGGIYIVSALAVILLVPYKIRGDIFVPYALILAGGISYRNRKLSQIRKEEQTR